MAQLTEKDSQISKLARKLTVAEVDSDWRRLLGASERGRRGRKEKSEGAAGEGGDRGEDSVVGDAGGEEGQAMGDRESDGVLALERELEAQRKDIARALRFNPNRSISPPARTGGGKLAAFVDPVATGLDEAEAQRECERFDENTVSVSPPAVEEAPVEAPKPKTNLTQSSRTRQQQQQRHFHSSGVGDLLSRPEDDARTYGMPSKATNQRGLQNSKRVGIAQPLDPSGGVAGAIENYAKIPQYKQVSELPAHLRGGGTVHGVLTSELGARAGRANRKYIPPPTTDPDGGFRGVLEGVYATGEAIPNSQKGRGGRLGRSRSPNGKREPSPSRSPGRQQQQQQQQPGLSPKAGVGVGVVSALAAGAQPPKEFTPFSNKPPGAFSLNRSFAPFATTETVAAVRSTVSAQESALMKMGMETTLLKAEMDKVR